MHTFTNCAISSMVEHEMKHASILILTLLRGDDPNALDHFVEKHMLLLERIEAKLREVHDAMHVDDLNIERQQLINLQNALPMIKKKIQGVKTHGIVNAEGKAKDMSIHCLIHWYQCAMEKIIWVVLYPEKISHALQELGVLVHSIHKKSMLKGITMDQKDDLHIMESNANLLYAFVNSLKYMSFTGMNNRKSLTRSCTKRSSNRRIKNRK